jgi:hypothetical protein
MKAKVTKEFRGCPDGEVHPCDFAKGDVISGDLAAVAVAEGWATKDGGKAAPTPRAKPSRPRRRKPPSAKKVAAPKKVAVSKASVPSATTSLAK